MTNPTANPKPNPGTKSEKPVDMTQYDKRIEDAVIDAHYMLMYASSNILKDIDQDALEKLINVRHHVENGEELSAEDEIGFWITYQELRKLILPATAESIKANLPIENPSTSKLFEKIPVLSRWWKTMTISRARRIVNRYVVFTGFVLILVLFFQIYWVVGNQLSAQLDKLLEAEKTLSVQINENPQKYSQKDLDSLETQILQTSLIFLDWSRGWNWVISNGDLGFRSKYAEQYADIDAQIKTIDDQLAADPDGTNAAKNDKDVLNAQLAVITDPAQINKVNMKIALVDEKSFLEQELASLDAKKDIVQGQINAQKDLKSTLETSLISVTADREAKLGSLAEQKSKLNVQLSDLESQLKSLGVTFDITPTSTPEDANVVPTDAPTTKSIKPAIPTAAVTLPPPSTGKGASAVPTITVTSTATSTATDTPAAVVDQNTPAPNEDNQTKIQGLMAGRESILSQITNIDNLLNAELNNTKAGDIQRQINDIDNQLNVSPIRVAGLATDKSNLAELLNNFPIDKETFQTTQESIHTAIGVMIDPTSTLATQLDDLDAAREALQARIESLQSQIVSIQIDVDQSSNQALQKLTEDVGLKIVAQKEQDRKQLADKKAALMLQEQADSIKEDARPVQLTGQFVLDILQSYLLPLLYGILGAATYVLRSLSRQIKDVTYSETAEIQNLLHISLGALAGIVVGWFSFLIPHDSFVGSISPMAVAFLVGYNIELLFTKMDDIVVTKLNEILQRSSPVAGSGDRNAALQKALSAVVLQKALNSSTSKQKTEPDENPGKDEPVG